MYDKDFVKFRIIEKLHNRRKWGGSHTENILNGLPRHLRGEKTTKEAIEELIREGWIVPAKKTGEIHFSLNPEKAEEILQFYENYYNNKNNTQQPL